MRGNLEPNRISRLIRKVGTFLLISVRPRLIKAATGILGYIREHHIGLIAALAAALACYFSYVNVRLMRESSALAEGQMRGGREQLDLLRESLGLMRKQLEAFKQYQEEVLAAPDFAVKVDVPSEPGAQVAKTGGPDLSEISLDFGPSALCVVTVQNLGRATGRNLVVTFAARREVELGAITPWVKEVPSRDPQVRLLRYQSRAMYPGLGVIFRFPVSIKPGTPDAGPQGGRVIIVWIEADNLTRQYGHVIAFRKRKSK